MNGWDKIRYKSADLYLKTH